VGSDEETNETPPPAPLPSRVERALARARAAAKADRERRGGRWLAIVPVGVAAVLLLLLMPRATTPESIPLPDTDLRVVRAIARADDARAAAAERERLPSDVLAVGGALRALNGAEARGVDEPGVADLRRQLDGTLRDLSRREDVADDLVALRALQTRRFLDALARWEASGETSDDFFDLAAAFVERASDAGWIEGRHVVLGDDERRVMFKTVWNTLTASETGSPLALTLDEQRVLYAFYLDHPRAPESRRLALETERRAASTPEACRRANAELARQTELWRADKIRRLGELDPSYPTGYALGVAYFRAGRFEQSADAFATFVRQHPGGPYTLRARNHLKGALVAAGTL
jgi:hypothetical protein